MQQAVGGRGDLHTSTRAQSCIGNWTSCICDAHVCCRDTTSSDTRIKAEIRSYPNPLVCCSLNGVGRLLRVESPQTLEQEPPTGVCGRSKDEHSHRHEVSAADVRFLREQRCSLTLDSPSAVTQGFQPSRPRSWPKPGSLFIASAAELFDKHTHTVTGQWKTMHFELGTCKVHEMTNALYRNWIHIYLYLYILHFFLY